MPSDEVQRVTLDSLARDLAHAKEERKEIESALSEAKADEARAADAMFDYLETEDVKTITHDLGRFTRIITHKAQVKAEDVPRVLEDLRDRGLETTHTKVVLRQAEMNALLKEINAGDAPPIDGVNDYMVRSIRFTPTKD